METESGDTGALIKIPKFDFSVIFLILLFIYQKVVGVIKPYWGWKNVFLIQFEFKQKQGLFSMTENFRRCNKISVYDNYESNLKGFSVSNTLAVDQRKPPLPDPVPNISLRSPTQAFLNMCQTISWRRILSAKSG